jgi:aspartyl-tRNA(Asn)/glutamyl-tRNA(Gln) amidotransferase subunit A
MRRSIGNRGSMPSSDPTDLTELSLSAAADLVARREVAPLELTAAVVARAEALEPQLNVYITPTFESAVAEAEIATAELAAGRSRGPLHGIPIALKDNYETAGIRTTAGSRTLHDHVPSADAHAVSLLKAAGAVLLGKLTMHELGMGGTNINPSFATPPNPWDLARITGGSSGGPAAAVTSGLCFAALGTDSRGSIRIPAALCGATGLKATYGRVSIQGIIPYCWSLDHAGPLARSAEDCALVLQAIAGFDRLDPTSVDVPVPDYASSLTTDLVELRVGMPRRYFFESAEVDTEVAAIVLDATTVLAERGAALVDVELSDPTSYLDDGVFEAEAAASYAAALRDQGANFGPDAHARLVKAQAVTAVDYARARYGQLELKRELDHVLDQVDLVLTPTCPVVAPRLDEAQDMPPRSLSRHTRVFNTAGLPTISLPCGFSSTGLPVGLSLTGRAWHEGAVLGAAHAYQSVTDWHHRKPTAVTKA